MRSGFIFVTFYSMIYNHEYLLAIWWQPPSPLTHKPSVSGLRKGTSPVNSYFPSSRLLGARKIVIAVYSLNITTLIFMPLLLSTDARGVCHLLCSSAPCGLSCCDVLCVLCVSLATWDVSMAILADTSHCMVTTTTPCFRGCVLNWGAALWGCKDRLWWVRGLSRCNGGQ